ncbi:MAG: aromatic ring-hydroxylating oxygenase subunit alpha [Candidatus Rokuibacteriota bacterium]
MPNDLDPALYATTRRPVLEAETLPPAAYTDPAFYGREVERIFRREWMFVGRTDVISRPGDYFTLECAGVPMIVSRGQDGRLRAFANACRHRGSLIVEGEGQARAFRCPYHSWTYGLDGRLLAASEMQNTRDFEPARYSLIPIRLETWNGFLFVDLAGEQIPLPEYFGDLGDKLASYRLEDMICVRRRAFDVRCNWKLFVENAMEELHIATVHRKTIQKYAPTDTHAPEPARGQYCALYSRHEGSMALLKGDHGFPSISTLEGKAATGTYFIMLYPMTMLACTVDCMWYLELRPHGPDRTTLVHGGCFPRASAERPDFGEVSARYYHRWDTTIAEDIVASEWQQRGLSSPLAARGRFSFRESLVHEIDNWVLDRVL